MKKLLLNLLLLALASGMVACSSSKPKGEPSNVAAITSQSAKKNNSFRMETIKQTARSLGAQASLAWRSKQLNRLLESQKKYLDRIFNFNYLLLNQNVMPPILVESKNTLNLADDFTIRVSDHDYQIAQPPRFITTPPNWRNYLWMEYEKPEEPDNTLLPQNSQERKTWNKYVQLGWQDGLSQADQIFMTNLNKLQRDFEGMILYRKLLAQDMVTPPYVAQTELGVTGDSDNIHINDRVLRITAISKLQPDAKNWRPVISAEDSHQLSNPTHTQWIK